MALSQWYGQVRKKKNFLAFAPFSSFFQLDVRVKYIKYA